MGKLSGKVALITGASVGIGRATAILFGEKGARVVVNYAHRKEKANEVKKEIEKVDSEAITIKADVSSWNEVRVMVDETIREFNRIDILVNNAGIGSHKKLVEISEADWDEMIGVHLKGTFNCSKAVLPIMLSQGSGKIINISSGLALIGSDLGLTHYCAANGGIISFTKALAREVGPQGINVNCVAPGPTLTEMFMSSPDEFNEEYKMTLPLKRFAKPREIAFSILFLASNESDYYAGQVLCPNGGEVM